MSKEQLIENMVTAVMEEFDFNRVHRVMVNLNWKWDIGDGKKVIPSTYRIMKEANRLLTKAASHYGEGNYSCGSGGFMAHLDGTTLTLQFILTEMTSYADDFINTEADA